MNENRYVYDKKAIRERRRNMYIIGGMIPVLMFVVALFFSRDLGESKSIFYTMIAALTVLIVVEILVVSHFLLKRLSKSEVIIKDSIIERLGGKRSEQYSLGDIKHMLITYKPDGSIYAIRLKVGMKAVLFYGYENMESLLNHIRVQLSDEVVVKEKQWKMDWNNPVIVVITMILTFVFALTIFSYELNIVNYFNMFFMCFLGSYFILKKPLSTSISKRFAMVDVGGGALMILCGVMTFAINFL